MRLHQRSILVMLLGIAIAAVSPAAALGAGQVTASGSAAQYLGDGGVNNVTVTRLRGRTPSARPGSAFWRAAAAPTSATP